MSRAAILSLLRSTLVRVAAGYLRHNVTMFAVIQNEDGSQDIIGPNLPADCVDDFFGRAAEGYMAHMGESPIR